MGGLRRIETEVVDEKRAQLSPWSRCCRRSRSLCSTLAHDALNQECPPPPRPPPTREIVNRCYQRQDVAPMSERTLGHSRVMFGSRGNLSEIEARQPLLRFGPLLLLGCPLVYPTAYRMQRALRTTPTLNQTNTSPYLTIRIKGAIGSPLYGRTRQIGSYYSAHRRSLACLEWHMTPSSPRADSQ